MANDRVNRLIDLAKSTLNFHFDVPAPGKEGSKPPSPARIATVLQNVLKKSQKDEVKARAKLLVASMSSDPVLRRFFSQSSNEDLEAFLMLDEVEQNAILQAQPKPALVQAYEFLKEHAPDLTESEEQTLRRQQYYQVHQEMGEVLQELDQWLDTRIDELINRCRPYVTVTHMCLGCKGKFRWRDRRSIRIMTTFMETIPKQTVNYIHASCRWKYFAANVFDLLPEGEEAKQVFVCKDTFWSKQVMKGQHWEEKPVEERFRIMAKEIERAQKANNH